MRVRVMVPTTHDVSMSQVATYLRQKGWTITEPGVPCWTRGDWSVPFDEAQADGEIIGQRFGTFVLPTIAKAEGRPVHEVIADMARTFVPTPPAELAAQAERRRLELTTFFTAHPGLATERCHAGRDGECNWARCPQLAEGEPEKTGRHCPLDRDDDDR